MREILFRGKPVTGERYFVNGGAIQGVTHELWQNSGRVFIMVFPKYLSKPNLYEVIPETVGQYTGLTDKNGKRIFEGDICRFREWSKGDMCWVGEVHWEHQQFVISGSPNKECDTPFALPLSRFVPKDIEIIGSIHDNPELMKEEPK